MISKIVKMVAVTHKRGTTPKGHHLKPVPRQLKVASDFWPQQTRNVGAVGVVPTLMQLATDGGTADVRIAFEHGNV